jgi:hypothetical protein
MLLSIVPSAAGALPGVTFAGNVESMGPAVSIEQMGQSVTGWWGLEHSAIVQAAATVATQSRSPCTVVEAGAHQVRRV